MFTCKKKYINWKRPVNPFTKFLKKNTLFYMGVLSRNPNIDGELVNENPILSWDHTCLHLNPNNICTCSNYDKESYYFMDRHMDRELIIKKLSEEIGINNISANMSIYFSANLTPDIVEQFSHLPWNYDILTLNPNFIDMQYTKKSIIDILRENKDEIDWEELSKKSTITWNIVKSTLDSFPWSVYGLSVNPNITEDIFESYPTFFRERSFQLNQNISFEKISSSYEKCSYLGLYDNTIYRREKSIDIKWRRNVYGIISEKISPFSRGIDKVIQKRLLYI